MSPEDIPFGTRPDVPAPLPESSLPEGERRTFGVTGMTCGHCVSAVREEVGAIEGVRAVEVELVVGGDSQVTVVSAGPVDDAALAAAVDEAGYELAEV